MDVNLYKCNFIVESVALNLEHECAVVYFCLLYLGCAFLLTVNAFYFSFCYV